MARKSRNGDGCISQRKDGRYVAILSLGKDLGGKRRRLSLYADTKKEARELLVQARKEHEAGKLVTAGRQTVECFLREWLKGAKAKTVKTSTLICYERAVELYIVPALGQILLSKLNAQHVQTFLNNLSARKTRAGTLMAPRTVRHIRTVFGVALNLAVKWDLMLRNPVALTDGPQIKKSDAKAFTHEEAQRFLKAIEGDRLECLYLMAISIGMRQGEILGLKWPELDLDAGMVNVQSTLKRLGKKRTGEAFTLTSTKTHKTRLLPIPGFVVEKLKVHRRKQQEESLLLGLQDPKDGFVFATSNATPFGDANIRRYYTDILIEAKLPHLRFHDLRHSCATLLLTNGIPISEVSRLLGHERVSTTLDIYSHVAPEALRRGSDCMEGLLGQTLNQKSG